MSLGFRIYLMGLKKTAIVLVRIKCDDPVAGMSWAPTTLAITIIDIGTVINIANWKDLTEEVHREPDFESWDGKADKSGRGSGNGPYK